MAFRTNEEAVLSRLASLIIHGTGRIITAIARVGLDKIRLAAGRIRGALNNERLHGVPVATCCFRRLRKGEGGTRRRNSFANVHENRE